MPAVASSTIKHIAWNEGDLTVQFHKTGTYTYHGVSEEVFSQIMASPSIGKALHQLVKTNGHKFTKTSQV